MSKEDILKILGDGFNFDIHFYSNSGRDDLADFIIEVVETQSKIKSREEAIAFLEYHEKFRREESRFFRECDRLGGIFSLADYGVENIYNDFVAKKPIKSAILPVESFWQYDENDKLVHVIPKQ